jgi:RHS repeat-associated protein
VFLDYTIITVTWDVQEVGIQDRYEIVLNATYETDVPAPVVVTEPQSTTLPQMKAGDVFNGEFTLTNYGLVRADNVRFVLPSSDAYYRYELGGSLPTSLAAKERVTITYRVTCLKSPDQGTEQGSGGAGGSCGGACASIPYNFTCANGNNSSGSASHCWTSSCAGKPGGAIDPFTNLGAGGPGMPEASGGSIPSPSPSPVGMCLPKTPRNEPVSCTPDPDCTDCKDTSKDKCPVTGSYVSTLQREYNRNETDLAIKAPGGRIEVQRWYYNNRWYWNDMRNNLMVTYNNDGSVGSVDKGGVTYKPASSTSDVYTNGIYRIIKKSNGWRWEGTLGQWKEYNAAGKMTSYGDRTGIIGKLLYEPGDNGKLIGVSDRNDRQVIWYEYNTDNSISAARDIDNRRVEYTYAGNLLTKVKDAVGNDTTYAYDNAGRITTITDAANHISQVSYSAYGYVSSVLDGNGNGQTFQYDYDVGKRQYYSRTNMAAGGIKEVWYDKDGDTVRVDMNGRTVKTITKDARSQIVTDEAGNVTRKDYDEWDNLTKVTYPDGTSATYEYEHTFNRRTKETNEKGVVTIYEYDTGGNLKKKTEAQGTTSERVTTYSYDATGNLLTTTVGNATATNTYDAYGNVTAMTDPEGNTTSFTYDAMGNFLTKTDGRGKVWTYTYDSKGRLLTAADPNSRTTSYTYDAAGNKILETDPAGKQKTFEYDQRNRLTKTTDAAGNITTFTYNGDGKLIRQTDGEGKSISYTYDLDGRLLKTIDGNGNEIANVYDDTSGTSGGSCPSCSGGPTGQPAKTIFPTFVRQYTYDTLGRKTAEKDVLSDTDSGTTTYAYDQAGSLITKTDKAGKTTAYEYDSLNRLTKVTDPLNQQTLYAYDSRDNLITLTDAKGQTTAFTYDRNNRLTQETRPLGQQTTYQYNQSEQLIRKTDAKGQRIEYGYDDSGRMTEIRHYNSSGSLTKTVTRTYDSAGKLTGYTDGTTSATYTYDDSYRKISETTNYGAFSLTTNYTYNRNGTKKTFTYPNNIAIEYSYDSNNQPAGINIPGVGYITYSAYQWNRPTGITLPGGSAKQYAYDSLMRTKAIGATDPGQNTLMNYQYSYDKVDNITAKNTESGNFNYGYDDLYRLNNVSKDTQQTEVYTYDPVGNRTTSATANNWQYNQNNELQSYDAVSFTYDNNGNTTQKNTGGQIQNFVYDVDNRLIEVRDGSNSLIAAYTYDPFGRRIKKDAGGTVTYYLYTDEGLIGEYDGSGTEIKTYGYKPNSTWTTDPVFMQQNGQYYFYHNDHLGTPMKMTSVSGAVVWSATYDAFGKATVDGSSTVVNNLRLPGQYYEAETNLHYNYHRYYDPGTGRYVTADPIWFQDGDSHLYSYASNNPVRFGDRYGLADFPDQVFPPSPAFTKCIRDTTDVSVDALIIAREEYDSCIKKCDDDSDKLGCPVNELGKSLLKAQCKARCLAIYLKDVALIEFSVFINYQTCWLLYQDPHAGGKEKDYRDTHRGLIFFKR